MISFCFALFVSAVPTMKAAPICRHAQVHVGFWNILPLSYRAGTFFKNDIKSTFSF